MTQTLFEISEELVNLQHALDSIETTEQQEDEIYQWLEQLAEERVQDRDRKLDNYAALIAEIETRSSVRKLEARRIAERARIDQGRADSLKAMLQRYFEAHQMKVVETRRYRLTLATNGGKLPLIVDEDYSIAQIPPNLVLTSLSPDKEAIRAALEAGEAFEFARFGERGKSLRIK